MAKSISNIIIAAHPDDETIFFAGLIQRHRRKPWTVICVTDGNADGQGMIRLEQFKQACKKLKVDHYERWDFPDIYEKRLNCERLITQLKTLPKAETIYTHSILGEYGHPHHQDVSYCVHKAFAKNLVMSIAQNVYPELDIRLTKKEYNLKTKILSDIYASEFNRFAHLLPASTDEGFFKLSITEVEAIYRFLTGVAPLEISKLQKYKWLKSHIETVFAQKSKRIF
ncbi:MAG: PIG-L family deacetylase [Bacteriovoracaceae bacterium]|nr:PIG-L family deacetylase [Bacteriovoracaceae bacterium]